MGKETTQYHRPTEYTEEVTTEIINKLEEYIANTDIPIFSEFCYKNKYSREYLYELSRREEPIYKTLSYSIKNCAVKKEAALERGGLNNSINTTMAIFSLKQLGWKDKQDITGNLNINSYSDLVKLAENPSTSDSN